jgi:3-deoxy-D-manno-octulosonate 8-phosphate phosphatase KdsC-like HAD superfamily phosphatase
MDFNRFVNENVHKAQRMNTIAVVTPDISSGLAECMIVVKNSGYNIAAFYCRDNIDSKINKEMLQRSGINCYSLDSVLSRA